MSVISFFYRNKLPLWTWECINERCVPAVADSPAKLQSLATCNMLCASLQLWPQPTGPVSLASTAVPVRADLFQLVVVSAPSKVVHEYLQDTFELFRKDLHQLEKEAVGFAEWRAIAVRIVVNGSADPRLRMDTDESYKLLLRPKSGPGSALVVDIIARSFCGARHGLESLLQLVWLDPLSGTLMTLEAAKIEDTPRFNYRGLLLDTARNFFTINDLMRTIDAMAACKLNTFHWHISDSQSFPLRLNSVPQLTKYGAYGPGAVYTVEDVRKIVRHARLRGVRILIEVNTPSRVGRAWQWGPTMGLGDLVLCIDAEPWTAYCNDPPCGQLNPRNPHVHELLEAIYGEIIQMTGVEDIFHIGADAISERCWREHFTDVEPVELWLEFTRIALQRLESVTGRLPNLTLLWSSSLNPYIKTDLKQYVHSIGLQARGAEWAQNYVSGIRSIASQEDPWDLNTGMGRWYEEADGMPYNSWQRVYEHRPWNHGGVGIFEGGEATVWSSSLSGGGLDARVWPRAAALAERLWSDRAEGATRPVHARLDVQRSRLVARGIQAAPLWSMWCTHNTYTCV